MRERLSVWWNGLRGSVWPAVRRAVPGLLRDLHIYGGLSLAGYGLWLWWPPAGFMGVGVLVLALGVFGVPSIEEGEA